MTCNGSVSSTASWADTAGGVGSVPTCGAAVNPGDRVITVTNESNGKPEGHSKHISVNETELGEASVSPAEGEIFLGRRHRPTLIAIGSTVYHYEAPTKGSHGGRPWVRSRDPEESPATQMLPFYGGSPIEVDAGGTGSFAQLINLLTAAVEPVTADGPALVQG